MPSRHAYLIIAYEQPMMLKRLIEALDDPRNDIFVHIDKKARFDGSSLSTHRSSLFIIPPIDARWGDYSLVEVELKLIEAALKHGPYTYLHLLSDSDYPIKSQDYIHAECERLAGKEFIGFSVPKEGELENKVQRYHLFPEDFKNTNLCKHVMRTAWIKVQQALGYRRNRHIVFRKGPQWFSITGGLAAFVYEHRGDIFRTYHNTFCPDEVFMQTLCCDWDIYTRQEEFKGCRRFIKWENNTIAPITESDIPDMIASSCWFARKFDERQMNIINEININS